MDSENQLLNRKELINTFDGDRSGRIWRRELSIFEVEKLLNMLENYLSKFDYEYDNNYIFNPRRQALRDNVFSELNRDDDNKTRVLGGALAYLFEFIGDDYDGGLMGMIDIAKEMGITSDDIFKRDISYRNRGIISAQEKEVIIEMINAIKEAI